MKCTKCNTENLDSAKFCKKCGYELNKNEIKQVKQKHSVKISGRKIKYAIIAVVIIGLISAGAMFLKEKSDEKRILSIEYLEELDERDESCEKFLNDIMGGNLDEKEINTGIEQCMEYSKEWNKAIETFVTYAKNIKFNNNTEIEEFIEKYEILNDDDDGSGMSTEECKDLVRELKAKINNFKKNTNTNEDQAKKLISIINESCYFSKLFDDIKIEKKTEQIEADYSEQENDKIPAGYSIVTVKPQNGEKENITIIVDGEEKGSGEVITKEPQNGVKMIGSGNAEDIAKQAEDKLNQILKLWREQNFTAATILPFLSEENQNKAPEWESSYKKVIFNWKRFDKVEPILGQVGFKENSAWGSKKNEDYPFIMNLPVTVSYYTGNDTPNIPFYYSAKKNEWVSGNGTVAKLFEIIKNQSIEAEIFPNSFTFPDTEACTGRRYFQGNKEVEIESAKVTRSDNFYIDFSASLGDLALSAAGFEENVIVERGSSVPLALVDYINKTKNTVLLGKSFKYRSYPDCQADTNISFTFFK